MALSVVLSQAARQDPHRRDFEEQLVTELLMEDNKEVHVIPDLHGLEHDDTGMLCLEGVTAHMIALTWNPPEQSFQQLEALGIAGRFGRTTHASETPPAWAAVQHPRTIYCLDLNRFDTVRGCRDEISRIDKEQSVQVFSIGIGASPQAPMPTSKPPTPKPPTPQGSTDSVPSQERQEDSDEPPVIPPIAGPNSAPAVNSGPSDATAANEDEDAVEEALDRLVDELDELDI